MLITAMRAGLRGCHRVTGAAEEGVVKEHGGDAKLCRVELRKDVVSIIRAIVVANTGMVATDDERRAAVVLAHQSMEDGFSRTSIAHGGGQHPKHDTIGRIIVLQQHFITAHAYIGGDIVALGITDQWMEIEAINYLQSALLNIFVGTVDRVAGLESNNALPAALGELLARLRWSEAILGKGLIWQCDHADRAAQQYVALLIDYFDAWVRLFSCAIDLAGLVLLIIAILLLNRHNGLQRAMLVDQCYLRAFFQSGGLL